MCGLYRYGGSRTHVCLAGTGLRPTRRARPRRCGPWLLTGWCWCETVELRLRCPPCLAPARPRDVACKTMRTAPEASRPVGPFFTGGGAVSARRSRPSVCAPDLDHAPCVFWPEVSHVNGVLPCDSLHRAVWPSVGGFLCNGTL